jgi:hypothetical protein
MSRKTAVGLPTATIYTHKTNFKDKAKASAYYRASSPPSQKTVYAMARVGAREFSNPYCTALEMTNPNPSNGSSDTV